jgi:transposase-like protein
VPSPGDYTVVATGKSRPALKCGLCGEIFPMQSNLAIAEELLRISAFLEPDWPACPRETCELYGKSGEEFHARYTRYGTNGNGTPRYKCTACSTVFSHGGKSDKRQRETHKNRDIFLHLVNTVPIRRVIKLLDLSMSVLYSRLDFIHHQCTAFVGERERTLVERPDLGKRYLSTDRQKLIVNWSSRNERKNTLILSIATADQVTGYVYGVHLNFDSALMREDIEKDRVRFGDHHLDPPFRRYARVWLDADLEEAAASNAERRKGAAAIPEPTEASKGNALAAAVAQRYKEATGRADIDAGDGPSSDAGKPTAGILLHEQIVMSAHLQYVTRLLGRAEKLRFFMDQESGLRAAFMAAVPARILDRTVDGFYVQVQKEGTVGQKRAMVQQSRAAFDAACGLNPGLTPHQVKVMLAREEMTRLQSIGQWSDKWFRHPIADMREPARLICWLTDIDAIEQDRAKREDQLNHHASLYLKASLTSIDRFFMQVRRALTMAERGIVSASADRRVWFGKNAYNPGYLTKLVEVFRVYFNYCEIGKDKCTPAMRMGLARGPVAPEDILYFVSRQQPRRRARAAA